MTSKEDKKLGGWLDPTTSWESPHFLLDNFLTGHWDLQVFFSPALEAEVCLDFM